MTEPCAIHYSYDGKGNIVLPDGPPFDGNPVLIKSSSGWVEAWWAKLERLEMHEGTEYEGFCWICLDDKFQEELDYATHWMPLPSLPAAEPSKDL